MQTTANYGLKKPDGTDVVDIQDFNDNADVIDLALKQAMDAAGAIGSHAATHRPGGSDAIPTAAPSGGLGTANGVGVSASLARADHTHLAFDSTNPVANGTASAGSAATAARRDHVHPTDTTRAPLASPVLTGTPTAPTAAADTSTTQIATTAFVTGQAGTVTPNMDGSAAVGTSKKYAREDHMHPSDTTRAPLASPAFTGTPTAPTANSNTNNNQVATTAFVFSKISELSFQTAGGTATDITLTGVILSDGYSKTFIASANNNGSPTTVNGKPLYKPGTLTSPTLISGKAYSIWYNVSNNCFFIKASAEGTATTAQVLAGVPFSNENDMGLIGTIPTYTGGTVTPGTSTQTKYSGYYSSNITISGDPDLIPANILSGKNIFGVTGTLKTVPANAHGYAVLTELFYCDDGDDLIGASWNGDKTGLIFCAVDGSSSSPYEPKTLTMSDKSTHVLQTGDDYLYTVGRCSDNGYVLVTYDGSSGQEYFGLVQPSLTATGTFKATCGTIEGDYPSNSYGGGGVIGLSNSGSVSGTVNYVATHIWTDPYVYPNHYVTNKIKVTKYTNGGSAQVMTDVTSWLGDSVQTVSRAIAVSKDGIAFFFDNVYCYKVALGASTWTRYSTNLGWVDDTQSTVEKNLFPFIDDGPGGDGYLYVFVGTVLKKFDLNMNMVWAASSTSSYGTTRLSYHSTATSIIVLMDTGIIVVFDKTTGAVKGTYKTIDAMSNILIPRPKFLLPGSTEDEIYLGYNQNGATGVIAKGYLI